MSASRWLRQLFLCYFSTPAGDRTLYRLARREPPKSLVEIGLGTGRRTELLLEFALAKHAAAEFRYVGIDLFEARAPASTGLALKQAHALLKPLGAKVQLVPGDPYSALARTANSLREIDWLIVSADVDRDALSRAWLFVPRMLHANSRVLVEEPGVAGKPNQYRELRREEIEQLAKPQPRPNRRAA